MRPRPIHHFTRVVYAAIIDATRQGVGNCAGESRTAGNGERVVATDGPGVAVIVVVCLIVVRHALGVVRRAEILILESARGRTVDVDTAVQSVNGRCRVTAKAPLWIAIAGITWGGGRILVGDSNTVR